MKINLPTREEINVYNSLDEQSACKNFFGKTLEEAEALFRENPLHYQEDLMWMGPVAFQFYVQALIRYIKSSESQNDSDLINCFVGLLESRLEPEPGKFLPVAKQLEETCRYVISNYERFDVTPEIYGDLRPHYENFIQKISNL